MSTLDHTLLAQTEFDNFGSVMGVDSELLCSFELLKPLDGAALKKELLKSRKKNSSGLSA